MKRVIPMALMSISAKMLKKLSPAGKSPAVIPSTSPALFLTATGIPASGPALTTMLLNSSMSRMRLTSVWISRGLGVPPAWNSSVGTTTKSESATVVTAGEPTETPARSPPEPLECAGPLRATAYDLVVLEDTAHEGSKRRPRISHIPRNHGEFRRRPGLLAIHDGTQLESPILPPSQIPLQEWKTTWPGTATPDHPPRAPDGLPHVSPPSPVAAFASLDGTNGAGARYSSTRSE